MMVQPIFSDMYSVVPLRYCRQLSLVGFESFRVNAGLVIRYWTKAGLIEHPAAGFVRQKVYNIRGSQHSSEVRKVLGGINTSDGCSTSFCVNIQSFLYLKVVVL